MGLFSKKESPANRYVQVKMTINGQTRLGWMADVIYSDPEADRSAFNKKYGISYALPIPDEIDGYPVLGISPNGVSHLYGMHTRLPRHAVFVCLRSVEQRFLAKKFDSDRRAELPKLQSDFPWKLSYYSSDAIGYQHYTVLGGFLEQTDQDGEKRKLSNLKLDSHYSDRHTLDVFMHFSADTHMFNNKKMSYGEFFPCLVREDIEETFTLQFPKNRETFF